MNEASPISVVILDGIFIVSSNSITRLVNAKLIRVFGCKRRWWVVNTCSSVCVTASCDVTVSLATRSWPLRHQAARLCCSLYHELGENQFSQSVCVGGGLSPRQWSQQYGSAATMHQ